MNLKLTKLEALMLESASSAPEADLDEYGWSWHEQQAYLRALQKLREAIGAEVARAS